MNNPAKNPAILSDPVDALEDVIGLCNKIVHDNEVDRYIVIADLIELRDAINKIRNHISTAGFKTIPKLRKAE